MSSGDDDSGAEECPGLDDIKRWPKSQMETWLSKRGLPKSGKTKEVLAMQILRCMQGGVSSSDSEDDVSTVSDSESLPTPTFEPGKWEDLTQPDQIPNICEEDVMNYYLHGKPPVTGGHKNLRQYLDKARRYSVEERYIRNLGFQESVRTLHDLSQQGQTIHETRTL